MRETRGRALWLSAGLALVLGAWLVATPAARPQEPKPAPPSEQKQGPIQPKPRPQEEEPYTLRVEAPLVTVDVVVTDRHGNFLPNLQKENFRLFEDGIEQTVTAGESSLQYDPASDEYTYIWKTDKAWAVTCQQLVVRFTDFSTQYATFKFK